MASLCSHSGAINQQSTDYDFPGGKLNPCLSITYSITILKSHALTELGYLLGCCFAEWDLLFHTRHSTARYNLLPMIQAFFLSSDDIMDASVTRRRQPCWATQRELIL